MSELPFLRAHHWQVRTCGNPHCHPHLVLKDKDDKIIADAVIDEAHIDHLCAELRRAAEWLHNQRRSEPGN